MEDYHVLIIGDSRTKHLSQVLNKTTLNIIYHVVTVSGARMRRIALRAITELGFYNGYHLIILTAGINDVSKLVWHPSRRAVPRYDSVHKIVECTVYEMQNAVERVRRFTATPVLLASLSGMDLTKYTPWFYGELYPLQPLIDKSIILLNHRIRGINRRYGCSTPDLSSDTNRCHGRGGSYRTHYLYLVDGLHPGFLLRERWANKIINFCARNFPSTAHRQDKIYTYPQLCEYGY